MRLIWGDKVVGWRRFPSFALLVFCVSGIAFAFSGAVGISNPARDSMGPWLAATSDNVVHAAWMEYDGQSWSIVYANNSGGSWHQPISLSQSGTNSTSPRIVSGPGGVLVAIWKVSGQDAQMLYYSRSADEGRSWSAAKSIPGASITGNAFDVAVGRDGAVGLVWEDNGSIRYALFSDGAWSSADVLDSSGSAGQPAIAADPNGGFGVTWRRASDAEIYYTKPGSGTVIDVSNTLGNSETPDIEFDSAGRAHIVWREANATSGTAPGQWDIWYASCTSDGVVQNKQDISNTDGADSKLPNIAVDAGDGLHVVWSDDAGGNYDILYAKSTDGGASWTPPANIAGTTGLSVGARIMADGNKRLHVVWEDLTPVNSEVYWNGFDGSAWRGAANISSASPSGSSFSFVLDRANRVHIAFHSNRSGNYQIYYAMDAGFGATQQPELKITLSGRCANENVSVLVQDQSGNSIPNARVDIAVYNATSLLWEDAASLSTNASGEVVYSVALAGYYKFTASKGGYTTTTRYFQISDCTLPSQTPTPSPLPSPSANATPTATPAEIPAGTPTPAPTATPPGRCAGNADCNAGICLGGACRAIPPTSSIMEPLAPGMPRLIVDMPKSAVRGKTFAVRIFSEYGSPTEGAVIEAFGRTYITNKDGEASVKAEQTGANPVSVSMEGYRRITREVYVAEGGTCGALTLLVGIALAAACAGAWHRN